MVWIWGNKSNHIFEIGPTFLSNEANTILNFFKEKTTTFSLQSTFLKVLSYLYTYVHFEQMFTWQTYVKGYELRKLDRLDCPATNCKNSTTTYTTTIAN